MAKKPFQFPAAGSQQADDTFISTKNQEELLTDLAVAYSQGDFALLGAKGSGKTRILTKLCRTLGLDTETMVLYQVGRVFCILEVEIL